MWGSESFGYIEAGLPEHYHNRGTMEITGNPGYQANESYITGAFYKSGNAWQSKFDGSGNGNNILFAASLTWSGLTSSPKDKDNKAIEIYGKSTTVQPPSIKVRVKTRYK